MPARKLPTLGDELANLKARVMALEAREPGAWARDATPLEQLRQTYLGNTGPGIGSLGPYGVAIGCRAYHSMGQAVPSGVWTVLALDSERRDDDHIHDLVTNNSRLTAQMPGWYAISGHGRFESSGLGTIRGLKIRLNGITDIAIDVRDVVQQQAHTFGIATIFYLGGTYPWYVELLGYQDTGGPLNLERVNGWSVEFGMAAMRI